MTWPFPDRSVSTSLRRLPSLQLPTNAYTSHGLFWRRKIWKSITYLLIIYYIHLHAICLQQLASHLTPWYRSTLYLVQSLDTVMFVAATTPRCWGRRGRHSTLARQPTPTGTGMVPLSLLYDNGVIPTHGAVSAGTVVGAGGSSGGWWTDGSLLSKAALAWSCGNFLLLHHQLFTHSNIHPYIFPIILLYIWFS